MKILYIILIPSLFFTNLSFSQEVDDIVRFKNEVKTEGDPILQITTSDLTEEAKSEKAEYLDPAFLYKIMSVKGTKVQLKAIKIKPYEEKKKIEYFKKYGKKLIDMSDIYNFKIYTISKKNFAKYLLKEDDVFNKSKFVDGETKLYLETNINFATSTEDSRSDAQAGTGTLGIKFERKFIYGKIRFTIFSKNNEIESENNNDNKIFGSNLLIPSNSSNSISNFSFLLGTKSFWDYDKVPNNIDLFSKKRFGGYTQFSIYNTKWVKGETTLPVTTTVLDLHLTYRLLSLDIQGKDNGRADFYIIAGYSNRRLGGDFGLDNNSELRKKFINTDELGFDALNIGARLEVSNFFGQVNLTNFGDGNIPGFSGNQAVITLGFNASLNLIAKENKGFDKEIQEQLN